VIIGGYLILALICFGGGIQFWLTAVPVDEVTETSGGMNLTRDCNNKDSIPTIQNDTTYGALAVGCQERETQSDKGDADAAYGMTSFEMDPEHGSDVDSQGVCGHGSDIATADYVLIADRSPMQQLWSKQFVSLVLFFAIHATQDMFTVTTARGFLSYMGDDETGNTYLAIFTLLAPVSILGLPFLDWILNQYGYHAGFQLINVLAIGHGIVMVSSESLNVQILGFLVASFFRCFLYATTFSFVPTFLGAQVVGKGSGILPCVTGIFGFVNIPLAHWAVNGLDGNFFYPNLLFTLLVLPCIGLAWIMGKGIGREQRVKPSVSSRTARPCRRDEEINSIVQ
jgi:hypothetical protein